MSRRFVAATEAQMDDWLVRPLDEIDLVVLMIDGLHVEQHLVLVAMAIDVDGRKHMLGLREGATENAVAVTALLSDLQSRGLRTDRRILAVLDGGKALTKGVRTVYGDRAAIQRCQAHKVRNVEEQLPEDKRAQVRRAMQQAYRAKAYATAKRLLQNLARVLKRTNPGAAASLEEGLEETIAVKAYGLPAWLERTLATTNAIENLIGSVRTLSSRVKRWKDGAMVARWMSAAVLEAETHFRRVKDHKGMKTLVAALNRDDQTGIANEKKVA